MVSLKKNIIWLILLTTACALVIWHVIAWQAVGKYDEMYGWLETGKAYLTVGYNIGLMLVAGVLLGLLMNKVLEVLALVESMKRK